MVRIDSDISDVDSIPVAPFLLSRKHENAKDIFSAHFFYNTGIM